jgi:hypothetical protein
MAAIDQPEEAITTSAHSSFPLPNMAPHPGITALKLLPSGETGAHTDTPANSKGGQR